MKKKYSFYSDPSHGWLKVSRKEVDKLCLTNRISRFSYVRGDSLYLEEDCDALLFTRCKEAMGEKVECREFNSNRSSRIRNYDAWRGQ